MISFKPIRRTVFYLFLLVCLSSFSRQEYDEGSVRYFDDVSLGNPIIEESEVQNTEESPATDVQPDHVYDRILDKVIEEGRFVEELDASSFFSLPVGISLFDGAYSLVVYESVIHADYAEFNAFLIITNPLDGNKLRLDAKNVRYSFSGGISSFRLELMESEKTALFSGASLEWKSGTYAQWDCNGLDHVLVNADLTLSDKKFVKVNPLTGEEQGKININISTRFKDINDFVVDVSIPAFKVKGFDEAYFQLKNAVLDCSDFRNASSFQLPADYPGGYRGEMKNLWRGIYVNEATVFLSSKFNTESQNNPVSFSASEMIIDDYGFTGVVTARNILNTEEGALGNWPFSINELSLGFFTGSFDSFGFSGDVMLPGSTTLIEYNAFLDYEGVYQFGITTGKDIEFDVFAANVELYETSEINVFIENGKFVPTALLDGNIAFSCAKSNGDEMASVPRLDFQGMRLSAAPQYFDIDYLAVEGIGSGGLAQFPISFNRIELAKQGNLIGFSFDVKVNLAPVDGAGITGEGNFSILADISGEKWRFEKLDLNAFAVDTQKEGAFSIKGELEIFRDDPVYGDAFYGNLKASFANTIQNQDGLELKVAGMFGKADFGRYFFVDAFVALGSASVPVGPFMLNGFGGGLSYGMKRTSAESEVGNRTVASVSGVRYLPDRTAGLGISAAIQAGIVQESLAKGSINFGVTFNRGTGGIKQISFYGEVAMIAPVESLSAVEMKELSGVVANGGDLNLAMSTPMKASISMEMIVEEKTFDAKLQVWLNVAGAIKGVGTNNLAGSAIFHYEPGKWNLLVGTPSQPVGVEFVGLIKTQSYFMAGHDLPAAMMMNEKVLSILGMSQADFNGERGENDLIYGNGLAFGTNFEISTGDLSFLIFYASLDLGAGFDVMLMDYGDYAFCEGGPNPVGINGWYASGQAYAYFAGKIGIKVKVFGKRKKFDIINVQTAAALRLEGPNPIWMKGVVGGKYKVLGGLVSGHCRFEVTVGEKCKLKTGPDELSDMTIISGLTPTNGDEEVDIFTLPQAVFNMPVGKELKISEDENLSREFRINLLEYSVYEGDRRLEGAVEWNPEKTTLAFTPGTIFYPETEYRVVAEISFDEKINGNWQQYQDENGELYVENKSVSFETGLLPDKIPVDYVDATYPVNRMMNFYKNENSNAYLIFNSDIAPFFQQIEGWEQKARWVPIQGGSPVKADFSYHPGSRELVSPVPSNILNETMYRFELVNIPLSDKNAIDRNVTEKTDRVLAESDSSFTDIRTRNAKGVISEQEEKVFYSLSFRTSKYNKFLDKLPGTEMNVRFLFNSSPGIDYPGATVYDSELFDGYELYGSSDFNSLIRCSAQLSGADWYQEHIYPLLYEDYPWAGDVVVNRDVSEYGMPPQHPVMIWQIDYDYILTDNDLATGTIGHRAEFAHFIYGVSKIWANDFSAIRNNIFASEINASNRTDQMEEVSRRHIWPQVDEGTYPIKVEYVLPGKNTVTSSQIVNLNNPYDVPQVETLTDDDQQIEP